MNIYVFYFADAGVVGNYKDAKILVTNTSSGIITGIKDYHDQYVSDQNLPTLNATKGLEIVRVLAWPTRFLILEVVSNESNVAADPNSR